ncbi:anaerobic ribonucleoside-triphosphate reductase activating protein [Persephonella sp.]
MIKIGGLQKFSLIDFPSRISAVIFTQGCNLRCPFCHNRNLVLPEYYGQTLDIKYVFNFLESRKKMIEGVVITGGEPTIYREITDFIERIKDMGFLVKLDTNGTNPEILVELINKKLLNYIAMDIKASFGKYEELAGIKIDLNKIRESIKVILNSNVEYEFRTTLVRDLITYTDIIKIGQMIKGAKRYVLQNFVYSENVIDKSLKNSYGFPETDRKKLKNVLKKYVKEVILR